MRQLTLTVLLITLVAASAAVPADGPVFQVRSGTGKDFRGPLFKLDSQWKLDLGKSGQRHLGGNDWLSLRQVGVCLPALPSEEHLVLATGDRIPFRGLRLADEKLYFRHPDLDDNKEVSVGLSSVAMVWRLAPDATVHPARLRHRLLRGAGKRDQVLLLNGDRLEGTLNALSSTQVDVEIARKNVSTKTPQVSAIVFSTDLLEKTPPKATHARVVLSSTQRSPGGRLTVVEPACDGTTFRARTPFGALLRVPVERVLALERSDGQIIHLSSLTPTGYSYTPYLDEKWPWVADANVRLGDLVLGGSTYDRGLGQHADSRITYKLDGKYRLFDTLVGLDEREGKRARVRVRVLVDGKAVELPKTEWVQSDGAVRLSVGVAGGKELTLEAISPGGPVQAVVNWVEARLLP